MLLKKERRDLSTSFNLTLNGVHIIIKKKEKVVVIHAIILNKPRESVLVCEIGSQQRWVSFRVFTQSFVNAGLKSG